MVFKNLEPPCYASITVEKNGLGTDANGGTVWLGPLAGWKITLSRPDGKITPVTMTTDGSGKVTFENLIPGVYSVKETVQAGWEAVSDNPQTVVIRDCEDARVLFENLEIAGKLQISGTKYFRAWVPPYQGVTVGLSGWGITATLKGTDPAVYVTTHTNALGNYTFSQATLQAAGMAIPGATITVCEEEARPLDRSDCDLCRCDVPLPGAFDLHGRQGELHQRPGSAAARRVGLFGQRELFKLRRQLHGEAWRQPVGYRCRQRHLGVRTGAEERVGQSQHDPGRPDSLRAVTTNLW